MTPTKTELLECVAILERIKKRWKSDSGYQQILLFALQFTLEHCGDLREESPKRRTK